VLKIRLTQAAEQQLEDVWFYTLSEWSEEQANQYISMIEQGIMQLLDNPYIGKARPEIKKDLRSLQIQKGLIFYRVGNEFIDVIGILRSRMDSEKWIDEKIKRTGGHALYFARAAVQCDRLGQTSCGLSYILTDTPFMPVTPQTYKR
jgi:toxin ParE1/3/4